MLIRTRRVYEDPAPGDGVRVLVDRVWPLGVSRERAAVSLWLKEIAPSTALRRWFGHDPARWEGSGSAISKSSMRCPASWRNCAPPRLATP